MPPPCSGRAAFRVPQPARLSSSRGECPANTAARQSLPGGDEAENRESVKKKSAGFSHAGQGEQIIPWNSVIF